MYNYFTFLTIVGFVVLIFHFVAMAAFSNLAVEKGYPEKSMLVIVLCLFVPMAGYLYVCALPDKKGRSYSQNDGWEDGMPDETVNTQDCNEADLHFVGFRRVDPNLTDIKNAYMFYYDFTNHKGKRISAEKALFIQYFQNGKELSREFTYYENPEGACAKVQSEILSKYSYEAGKGETVRFGDIVAAEDESPVTVIVTEIGKNNHKKMIEVNLNV